MIEWYIWIYLIVGILISTWRLSKIEPHEDSPIACILGVVIIILWPLYIIYKIVKNLMSDYSEV